MRSPRSTIAPGSSSSQQDVTPMALAVQAFEAKREREPLEAALERVLKAMRTAS